MLVPGFTIDPIVQPASDANATMTTATTTTAPEIVLDGDALARKKLLPCGTSISTSVSAPSPVQHQPHVHQYAAFRGLYVVQSATEARHVRYAMEIYSPELQLHVSSIQRYSSFFVLRKRLLRSLKKCQDELARPSLCEPSSFLFDLDLRHTLLQPCCAGCASVRRAIKTAPFPKRAVLFTTVEDVDARAPLLEAFLDVLVRLLVDWTGCARGRKFVCVVLGKFLSINLLFHVFHQLRLTLVAPATAPNDAQDKAERVVSVGFNDSDEGPQQQQRAAGGSDKSQRDAL